MAGPAVSAAGDGHPEAARAAAPERLAVNFLFLTGAECASKLLTFLAFTYLARRLGPVAYGFLEFTLAVMIFFTLPTDWGLGSYGTREIARNPAKARALLHEITGLRLALALASLALLAVFILFLHKDTALKLLLTSYGLSLLGIPFVATWFFQAHDRMHWAGTASVVRQAVFAGLVFLWCHDKEQLVRLGFIECASVAATAAYCGYITGRRMGFAWPWPDPRFERLLPHLSEAFPIGLVEFAWAFMWYSCTVLLGLLHADATLGYFGASHRALMAMHTFVWLYFFNLLASISRCVDLPREHLLKLMKGSVRFLAWTGPFAAALLAALSPELLSLIYGRAFRPAWHSFAILVWLLPVAMLGGHHRYILIANNHPRALLRCTAISAVAAVALGLVLIPFFGGPGAGWALLLANLLNFALVYRAVKELVVEVPFAGELKPPLAALAFSGALFAVVARWNVWAAAAAGIAAYLAILTWAAGPELGSFLRAMVRSSQARANAS